MFVFRPELLMLAADGTRASPWAIAAAVILAVAGIVPLAAAIAGYLWRPLTPGWRLAMLVSSGLLLLPGLGRLHLSVWHAVGVAILITALLAARRSRAPAP